MKTQIWSVTTLVGYLKNSLENDMVIQSILVKGEISNFTNHRSGHLYFSLKDGNASIPCVMFSSYAKKMKLLPKEGMQVIVQAKVSLYEPRGSIQLYITSMQSDGLGDLYLRFEEIKKKLYGQGLFDPAHKKKLPLYPKNIGIISAKTGAAIQDVLSIISRRWPICDVHVYPSLVQGEYAAKNIIQNLKIADENQHDVILLVRGGGSIEDLWCFNDEELAYVIFNMKTCIVSGVGHESDTTLVDYVSDYRAPTPSAAAELITPDYKEILNLVEIYKKRLVSSMYYKLQSVKKEVEYYKDKKIFKDSSYLIQNASLHLAMAIHQLEKYEQKIHENQNNIAIYKEKLTIHMQKQYDKNNIILNNNEQLLKSVIQQVKKNKIEQLSKNIALLDAYSPLKSIVRGYAIVKKDDHIIRSVKEVQENDSIQIQLKDGTLQANITERNINNYGKNEF